MGNHNRRRRQPGDYRPGASLPDKLKLMSKEQRERFFLLVVREFGKRKKK